MIVVTNTTARCPICAGVGRRVIEHLPDGTPVEAVTACIACGGSGHIRQAGHTEETP